MQLTISRRLLFPAIELIFKAADKRHNMAILGNLKIVASPTALELTASDLEVEVYAKVTLPEGVCQQAGQITVPADRFHDIIKFLPSKADKVNLVVENNQLHISAGTSRFKLNTLPAEDFPHLGAVDAPSQVQISDKDLINLLDKTEFAVAVQDVRYYLTGMLCEFSADQLTTVATDGHRLALATAPIQNPTQFEGSMIVPRKGVKELQRLLQRLLGENDKLARKFKKQNPVFANLASQFNLNIGKEFFQIVLPFTQVVQDTAQLAPPIWVAITTKLIDGKFPDYRRVIPTNQSNVATLDHAGLQEVLRRVAILSDEKTRGIIFNFDPIQAELIVKAHNADRDEATERLPIQYAGEALEISFNVAYLLDVLEAMNRKKSQDKDDEEAFEGGELPPVRADADEAFDPSQVVPTFINAENSFDVVFKMGQANGSVLLEKPLEPQYQFVVMPMRI
ncbi:MULTISPECIES: DNA polymerase III subunit beta [unclassified Moraxella]|uniref:DNA polymerase III subunit beta n=1 Tax=unclassified Moraxella TaxID=2685852 RepID=UPI003AF950CC